MNIPPVIVLILKKIDKYGFITLEKAIDIIHQKAKKNIKNMTNDILIQSKLLWKSNLISTISHYRRDIKYIKEKNILEKGLIKLL